MTASPALKVLVLLTVGVRTSSNRDHRGYPCVRTIGLDEGALKCSICSAQFEI